MGRNTDPNALLMFLSTGAKETNSGVIRNACVSLMWELFGLIRPLNRSCLGAMLVAVRFPCRELF